jgi:DinB family protein
MPALGFVQLAVNHTIHHRGQMSVYRREIGVAVPPIYGERPLHGINPRGGSDNSSLVVEGISLAEDQTALRTRIQKAIETHAPCG